jgi:Tfp pilus assembly protein PilX
MNFLLFVLEILFIVTVIALVPARPELSPARVIHNERKQKNTPRS